VRSLAAVEATRPEDRSSACGDEGESSVVQPASPGIATTPQLLPNDSATLSGGFGTLTGTIDFQLFECDEEQQGAIAVARIRNACRAGIIFTVETATAIKGAFGTPTSVATGSTSTTDPVAADERSAMTCSGGKGKGGGQPLYRQGRQETRRRARSLGISQLSEAAQSRRSGRFDSRLRVSGAGAPRPVIRRGGSGWRSQLS